MCATLRARGATPASVADATFKGAAPGCARRHLHADDHSGDRGHGLVVAGIRVQPNLERGRAAVVATAGRPFAVSCAGESPVQPPTTGPHT